MAIIKHFQDYGGGYESNETRYESTFSRKIQTDEPGMVCDCSNANHSKSIKSDIPDEKRKLELAIRELDEELKKHSFEIQRIFRKRAECYQLLESL